MPPKMIRSITACLLASLSFVTWTPVCCAQDGYGGADDDDDLGVGGRNGSSNISNRPSRIIVPAFVTYWSHDALGYHPSICMTLENKSSTNLVGEPIQLQAQFRVIAEGILSIARWQTSFDSIGGKEQINTEAHSKRAFELPLDRESWPLVECKIVAKIGRGDRAEAETLLITRIDSAAMSEDDARSQLNMVLGRKRLAEAKSAQARKLAGPFLSKKTSPTSARGAINNPASAPVQAAPPPPKIPEKPMSAVAKSLPGFGPPEKPQAHPANQAAATEDKLAQFAKSSDRPGLGDDFYLFEKSYSMPQATDLKDPGWVWASYRPRSMQDIQIFAGSKGRTGKADVVVAIVPIASDKTLDDLVLGNAAKSLSGKFKNEKTSPLEHSVRYTSGGRVELLNLSAQSYRATFFKAVVNGQSSQVVAVSRIPGSLSELLKDAGRKTDLVSVLSGGLGDGQGQSQYLDGDDRSQRAPSRQMDDGRARVPSRPARPEDWDVD